ncbi:hypothetical protein CASFOL_028581 [Castilleja foliolosa]|uniref:Uncharacterized protein n=1 Tax=Castilleja foliolosa TaxID=1961234 RepID=A0ABD3CBN0_9LAMI
MEIENIQNSKRPREEKIEHDRNKGKKRSSPESVRDFYDNYDPKQYEFCDDFGVFDFPWLKEGKIFIADEYLETEEELAPYSFLDDTFKANLDTSGVQNIFAYEYNFHDKKVDEDGFSLLEINDFEQLDCIWSCPCDQALDIGLKE